MSTPADLPLQGTQPTFGNCDPDAFRSWMQQHKSVARVPKLMSLGEAVSRFVHDGDYVKLGGFGQVRTAMAGIFEIIRQRKHDLTVAGHTTSHDLDLLLAGGCVSRIEVAYSFGHEFRPKRSAVGPRLIKSGKLQINEWSNASFAWRLKAAMMGLSFIPARFLLGTDTYAKSGAKQMVCPFTGQSYAALPALYPDVAVIHVHRADRFGNCQIDGMLVSDDDAARASRRVIITAEEIVDAELFASKPDQTIIPYYCVDAVVEAPFGAYPCEMPGRYWFDEHHIAEYLRATDTPETLATYLDKYYYGCASWNDHLAVGGGLTKLNELRQIAAGVSTPPLISDVWSHA